jgi:hypothetical protein
MSNKKLSFDEWLKILKEKDFDFYSVSKTEDLYGQYRIYEKNFKEVE